MKTKLNEFLKNVCSGFIIGIAFIIPGFSGGTIAVMIGIYDKLINSVTNIFKQFKQSVIFLAPLAIGMVLAFAALYFPIKLALTYIPFPTLCLFVGLMLGGMPGVIEKAKGMPDKKIHLVLSIIAGVVAMCVAGGIGMLPSQVLSPNLADNMIITDYLLLFAVCFLAACALVVPGISGSLILMIFGYYSPILYDVLPHIFSNFGHNFLVLAVVGVGIVVGFFAVSFLMRYLLKKFPRGTYYAIIGFVLGSAFAVFHGSITGKFTVSDGVPLVIDFNPVQVSLAVVLGIIGLAASLIFYYATVSKVKAKEEQPEENSQ